MMSHCMVQDRQAQQALGSNKTDSWRSSGEQSWMRMTLLRTTHLFLCRLIGYDLVLNFSINSLSQHLFARAGRCRGWCPVAWFKIGRRSKLLAQTKQTPDEVAASSHGWEWRFYALVILQITRISDSSCKKTSLQIPMSQMEAELQLPLVQNSQSRVVASLTHIANCPSNVRWQLPDLLIPWLNLVHCGPCLLCHPRAGWKQLLDFHHGN